MKLTLLFLLSVYAYTALSDRCIGAVPPVSVGSACSSSSECRYGSYCKAIGENTGTCQKLALSGEACQNDDNCELFHSCIGPENNQICVKNANPGEPCSSDSSSTIARCPNACVSNVCQFANVGDLCTTDKDCIEPMRCADVDKKKLCVGLTNGSNCTSSLQCEATSYCSFNDGRCTARKTSGQCSSGECADGYDCARKSVEDERQCIAVESLVAGSYCEDSAVCESKRCFNNFCAEKSATSCTESEDDCSSDRTCRCGANFLEAGVGTCVANPCVSASESLLKCVTENGCRTDATNNYENSCAYMNCKSKYEAVERCNSSAAVIISTVTTLFAILAVVFF